MPPLPEGCFLNKLDSKAINGQKVWYSDDRTRMYIWDHTHNDVEVFNAHGRHLGSARPLTGETYKPAVKGRRLYV